MKTLLIFLYKYTERQIMYVDLTFHKTVELKYAELHGYYSQRGVANILIN